MKTYDPAPQHVHDLLDSIMGKYHHELDDVGLKVDLLYVSSSKEGPALTQRGQPAYAVVRALDSKSRAMGRGDAEIVIDRDKYELMPEETREALLDHELYHIELVKDRHGDVKLDDHRRPKLKMRKHDYEVGFFHEIVRRHGEHSIEWKQANALKVQHGQLYFTFESKAKQAAA